MKTKNCIGIHGTMAAHGPKVAHLLKLRDQYDKLRNEMGFSAPGEIIGRHEDISREVLVVADGLGCAEVMEIEGHYPVDFTMFHSRNFESEKAALAFSEGVELRGDQLVNSGFNSLQNTPMKKKSEQQQEVRVTVELSVSLPTKYSAEAVSRLIERGVRRMFPSRRKVFHSVRFAEEQAIYSPATAGIAWTTVVGTAERKPERRRRNVSSMCYLKLFHGRETPDTVLSDWGSEGPVIGPVGVSFTYGGMKIHSPDWTEFEELRTEDGMFVYAGVYYGDADLLVEGDPIVTTLRESSREFHNYEMFRERVREGL